jgi:hypothetical protein
MVDLTAISTPVAVPPVVAPLAGPALPPPQPADTEDPFGPAVVIGPSAQPPAIVLYDASGRLTTTVPADAQPLPPSRIDVGDPATRDSLLYTS